MEESGAVRRQKFFKILLPGSFESSLSLPPKFAARLDQPPVLAVATLRDPTGRSWHVGLVRHGAAGLRFDGKGWRSFVAGCSLSAGQLLVFDHLDDLSNQSPASFIGS
ncbi:B3 domain-containing protein Os03g0212300-like [Triticum aestivum]|uniref:B3 domain-containing protein Os03g0212300-like n=1 Tax=Triticum aestivum TaxID=4565 RepID=UPI001D02EEFE|nr:B3 domain-containing protein Os03g0212300-like [Triticum aestivum]